MQSHSPYHWRRRVGMRDVDAWGIVWYGNYLVFCDEARAELLRSVDVAPGSLQERGFVAPVVELKTRYHAPARFDDELDVHIRLASIRGTRLCFSFTIRNAQSGELLARIETTQVLMRTTGELVYLIPEEIKGAVEAMRSAQPAEDP